MKTINTLGNTLFDCLLEEQQPIFRLVVENRLFDFLFDFNFGFAWVSFFARNVFI